MTLKGNHAFHSALADDPVAAAAGEILPQAHWNADIPITGTADATQLPATVPLAVSNDTNIQGSISAQTLTFSWAGTLAAARLNANVVQGVTNDTNIAGSISGQVLTFSWAGTLAAARLNANVVQAVTNDTNIHGAISAQNLTFSWSGLLGLARGGVNADLSATGGAHKVLMQTSVGGAITVAQLTAADISGLAPGGSSGSIQTNNGSGGFAGDSVFTYTAGGPVTINPTATTNNQGVSVTQSTPNSPSVAGPVNLNLITVIDGTQTVTGSGDDSFGQIANRTNGFQVNYRVTGGLANHFGINAQMDVTATNGGTVALCGGIRTNSGSTITGDQWGIIGFIKVAAGSTLNQTGVGIESEVGVASTGAIRDRIGFSALSYGAVAGTGIDAAYTVSVDNEGGAYAGAIPFSNGLYFSSNLYSAATFPVAASGSLFLGDTGTVTNLLQFPTLTITGNLLSTPHVTWAGGGNLQINKTSAAISANAAVLNTTVADFVNVDASPARLAVRAFGAGAGAPSYIGYAAGGIAATPTQTLSGDGLVFVGGVGYSAADNAYNTGGGAGFLAIATENFDSTHGGTKLQIIVTPSGSKTEGIGGTFWGSQGFTVGSGGLTDPGTGVVRVSSGYQIGNSAPTSGHVFRSNGTSFVDAQLGIGDLSGLGTGIATALGVNTGSSGAPVLFNGAGGTPSSLTLTNATGLPIATGLSDVAWTAYTPTVTSGTGSITTLGTVAGRSKTIGKTVHLQLTIPITTAGTGGSNLIATLPVTAASSLRQVGGGFDSNTGNLAIAQILTSDSTHIYIAANAGATIIANGTNAVVSIVYEAA